MVGTHRDCFIRYYLCICVELFGESRLCMAVVAAAREVATITRSARHVQASSRGTSSRIVRGHRTLILSFNILAGISNLRRARGTFIVLSISPPR